MKPMFRTTQYDTKNKVRNQPSSLILLTTYFGVKHMEESEKNMGFVI
jgi:hypothetical protein